jgi:hypothetical protein
MSAAALLPAVVGELAVTMAASLLADPVTFGPGRRRPGERPSLRASSRPLSSRAGRGPIGDDERVGAARIRFSVQVCPSAGAALVPRQDASELEPGTISATESTPAPGPLRLAAAPCALAMLTRNRYRQLLAELEANSSQPLLALWRAGRGHVVCFPTRVATALRQATTRYAARRHHLRWSLDFGLHWPGRRRSNDRSCQLAD